MDGENKRPLVPSYVLGALVAGLCFLLVALILGALIFSGQAPAGGVPDEEAEATAERAATIEKSRLDTRMVVVIDAGHGGYDPGAVNQSFGVTETEVTQALAERVLALLARHEDELVCLQANAPGTYASPMARANTAVSAQADLMVSMHLNADESPYVHGFQVFPAPPGRMHHEQSERFATLLVQRMGDTGVEVLGENGIFYHYYNEYATGGYWKEIVDSGYDYAQMPREDESFGVVEYAGCPSVLAEMWYLSSGHDMGLFYSDEGCDVMARAVYLAICDYLELEPR